MPNTVCLPELCIRITLEAARIRDFSLWRLIFYTAEIEYINSLHLKNVICKYREFAFKAEFYDYGSGCLVLALLAVFSIKYNKSRYSIMRYIHRDHPRKAILCGVVITSAELGIKLVAGIIEDAWARGF